MKTTLLMLTMLASGLTASAAADLQRASSCTLPVPAGAMCAKDTPSETPSISADMKRMPAGVMKGPAIGNDDLTLDPKTLTYLSPDPFYGLSVYPSRAMNGELDVMARFDGDLLNRFAGNRISSINAVLDAAVLLGAKVFIKNADFETIFEEDLDVESLGYFEADMTGNGIKYQLGKLASVPTEYIIDGEPIYIGYQVQVDPEVGYGYFSMLAQQNVPHKGCCVFDRYDGYGPQDLDYCVPMIWCETEGEGGLSAFDVSMNGITDMRALCNSEYTISGTLTNFGTEPVDNITFSYTGPDGTLKERTLQSSEPLPYMTAISFNIPIVANAESGIHSKVMEVSDINGHKDEVNDDNSTLYSLVAIDQPVDRRLLLEDFTGDWCGFCVRGIASFKLLHEMYPDNCITTNFHVDDSMSVKIEGYNELAFKVPGYPESYLNHIYMMDPWTGIDPAAAFGMGDVVKMVLGMPVEIAIDGEGIYDPETGEVGARMVLTPTLDVPDASIYRVGYTVVEDGYTGVQANGYSSEAQSWWTKDDLPEAIWPYYDLPAYFECEFEDVVRDGYNVLGTQDSMPARAIAKGNGMSVSASFPASNVTDFSKASLVAYVMDASTTEVLDAVKVSLNPGTVGATVVNADVLETAWFDMQGLRVSKPGKGIYLKAEVLEDGTVRTSKVCR